MPQNVILVIDDEKNVLELLRYNLVKEGYEVLGAETGEKGFEWAQSKRPDMVILDLMLPGMDGLEVCRLLKSTPRTKSIPILILTAKGSEVDQVVGLELGACDYLTKPFSIKVLLARVKNGLKTKISLEEPHNVIQFNDLELNRERVLFTIRGNTVPLTKKEIDILGALMERSERVLSRQRLSEIVWGSGTYISGAAVNMHLKSLRDKLGKYRGCIETVRGSGYRFVPKRV